MGLSLAVVLFWYFAQSQWSEVWIFQFDPVWPGLIVSAAVFFAGASFLPLAEKDKQKIEAFWA
jgi:Na+/pantothenate symporter